MTRRPAAVLLVATGLLAIAAAAAWQLLAPPDDPPNSQAQALCFEYGGNDCHPTTRSETTPPIILATLGAAVTLLGAIVHPTPVSGGTPPWAPPPRQPTLNPLMSSDQRNGPQWRELGATPPAAASYPPTGMPSAEPPPPERVAGASG